MIKEAIQKALGEVKENYGYYKLGKKVEYQQERRARVENNIKNLKEWHPEAAGRMQKQYDEMKRRGQY